MPDQPLPGYDSPPAVAYAAIHARDPARKLFALVCDPKLPPRIDIVAPMHRIDHVNLMRSEEHTSELQSLMRNSYAVFCLKKKKTKHTTQYITHISIHTHQHT